MLSVFSVSAIETNPFISLNLVSEHSTGIVYTVEVSQGKIFLGSDNGVFVLEGDKSYHINSSRNEEAAPVIDLAISRDNTIWAAAYGTGLLKINHLTPSSELLEESEGLVSNYVTRVEFIDDHRLLISSVFGLQIYDIKSKEFHSASRFFSGYIDSGRDTNFVRMDHDNIVVVNSENGFILNSESESALTFELPSELQGHSFSKLEYHQGILWLLSYEYLFTLNLTTNELRKISLDTTNNVPPKDVLHVEGRALIASEGLYEISKQNSSSIKSNLMSPFLSNGTLAVINDLELTKTGQIVLGGPVFGFTWLPSTFRSLNYLSFKGQSIKGNLQQIVESKDGDAVVLISGELFVLDDFGVGALHKIETKNQQSFTSLVTIRDDTFAISNSGDVFSIVGNELLESQLSFNLTQAFVSPRGTIGISDEGLLAMHSRDSKHIFDIPNFKPNSLYSSDNVAVAIEHFRRAFISYDYKTWIELNHSNIQESISIGCIERSANGTIYFCSSGDGILTLEPETSTLVKSRLNQEINSKFIRALKSDVYGYLWIATNSGLYRADPNGEWVQKITQKEGVIDLDFEYQGLYTNRKNDRLFVVGDKLTYVIKLSEFHSVLNRNLETENSLLISEFKNFSGSGEDDGYYAQYRSIDGSTTAIIENNVYLTEIHFAADDAIAHRYLEFEYRLKGLDNRWRKAKKGNASATFSTLPFGNYEFQARAIDQRSLAEQPITSLKIQVLPPLWLTLEAFVFYFLLIVCIYYLSKMWQRNLIRTKQAEIDGLVHERTFTLSEKNESLSKQLDKNKNLFSSLSHEIRTPLTILSGWLNHVREKRLLDSKEFKIDAMLQNSNRLRVLVDQLLELERVGSNQTLRKQTYDLFGSTVLIVESFKPLAQEKYIEVSIKGRKDIEVELIEGALEKILSNILSNAIKYSPEESTVEIFIRNKKGMAEISIADSGDGIPEKDLSSIFERFSRLQMHEGLAGTGIGLAVVKEMTEANNGNIDVVSELGVGTTFTIVLPVVQKSQAAKHNKVDNDIVTTEVIETESAINRKQQSRDVQVSLKDKSKTVLIVDDSEELREYIYKILKPQFNCLRAINGKEGFEVATTMLPDAIISDVVMPGLDGISLTEKLRKQDITAHIPIILVSAKGELESKIKGLEAKADDYLVKPFNEKELLLKLVHHIESREAIANINLANHEESLAESNVLKTKLPKFDNERDQRFYTKLLLTTHKHYTDDTYSREVASSALNCTDRQLNRKLNALVDLNFTTFLKKYRLEQAKKLLLERGKVGDVAFDVGFTSPSYFGSCFKNEFGETPKEFIERIHKINNNPNT